MGEVDYYGNGQIDFITFEDDDKGHYSNPSHMKLHDLLRADESFARLMKELVEGKDIVEIGSGEKPLRVLFQFSPRSYTCVEPTNKRAEDMPEFVKYEQTDGLTYLQEIPESSVVVVSSYLFDRGIMSGRYETELTKLIFKKTIPEGLSFHVLRHGVDELFLPNGFTDEFVESLEDPKPNMEESIYQHGTPFHQVYWSAAIFRKI